MAVVYASTSHKGGTGRSVTTANVAFRMALRGHDVCLVDLDLTSPTLGAVLDLEGLGAGAKEGIHDLLPRQGTNAGTEPARLEARETRRLLVNIWDRVGGEVDAARKAASNVGALDLLPGTAGPTFEISPDAIQLGTALLEVFQWLESDRRYSVIFVDVRSGLSDAAKALVSGGRIDTWILFHRWTNQHVAGAIDLADKLLRNNQRVVAVRTADVPPSLFRGNEMWFSTRDRELRDAWQEGLEQIGSEMGQSVEVPRVGTVPLEPSLQVKERLITHAESDRRIADRATVDAYSQLARELEP